MQRKIASWTTEDLSKLKTYYTAGYQLKNIGGMLGGRTASAISKAVARFNIERDRKEASRGGSRTKTRRLRRRHLKITPLCPNPEIACCPITVLTTKKLRKVSIGKKIDQNWVKLGVAIRWLQDQGTSVKRFVKDMSIPVEVKPEGIFVANRYLVDQKVLTPLQLVMVINQRREEMHLERFLVDKISW